MGRKSVKNNPALVIMAAGMGTRYGGLKQVDTFTPEGDTIIDFSLYDALRAGFKKVVFVIREEFAESFEIMVNKKLNGRVTVEFVYQEPNHVPKPYFNENRIKPWGTGHALLMTKNVVKENFAIINADDFYGKEAFENMAKVLSENDTNSYNFYSMAYYLKNTISKYGSVSRGECTLDQNGYLLDITERSHIEYVNGHLMEKDHLGKFNPIDENTIVSMNFWGFTPKCFDVAESLFLKFLKENKNDLKVEFYLPTIVNEIINVEKAKVKVLRSRSKWHGVTYKEDKLKVEQAIADLKKRGVYPTKLWDNAN